MECRVKPLWLLRQQFRISHAVEEGQQWPNLVSDKQLYATACYLGSRLLHFSLYTLFPLAPFTPRSSPRLRPPNTTSFFLHLRAPLI